MSVNGLQCLGRRLTYILLVVQFVLSGVLGDGRAVQAQEPSEHSLPTELWFGVLRAEGRHFRFLITLTKQLDTWSGQLKSLDEGGAEFKLDDVRRTDDQLNFELKRTDAVYESKLNASGKLASGQWKQRGVTLPLELERVEKLPEDPLRAVWTGKLNALVQKLRLRVRELESGVVYFDSISQKAGGFVAEKTVEGDKVVFEVPAIGGKFEGELSADGLRLVGQWKQGFLPMKLVLEKEEISDATDKEEVLARPQTPQPPFPYSVEQVEFKTESDQVRLSGTLTIPRAGKDARGDHRFPAVILISGSGPQDRDETIFGHKPFWVIADLFSRNGIAVLRYDERGVGQSTGDFAQASSEDFARDVSSAVDFLRRQDRIDPEQIGLCGHSEGGLVAAMVAAADPGLAFIILMAGPGVNGEQILTSQSRLILEASGIEDAEIERQSKIQKRFIELAKQKPRLSKDEFLRQGLQSIEELLAENEKTEAVGQSMVEAAFAQLGSPWFQFFLSYEPSQDLERVQCSVLAINGEKDLQVDPKLNLPAIRAALQKAPAENFKLVELPGLNHLFQASETGLVHEYGQIEQTIDPSALKLMIDWIREQTGQEAS